MAFEVSQVVSLARLPGAPIKPCLLLPRIASGLQHRGDRLFQDLGLLVPDGELGIWRLPP